MDSFFDAQTNANLLGDAKFIVEKIRSNDIQALDDDFDVTQLDSGDDATAGGKDGDGIRAKGGSKGSKGSKGSEKSKEDVESLEEFRLRAKSILDPNKSYDVIKKDGKLEWKQ